VLATLQLLVCESGSEKMCPVSYEKHSHYSQREHRRVVCSVHYVWYTASCHTEKRDCRNRKAKRLCWPQKIFWGCTAHLFDRIERACPSCATETEYNIPSGGNWSEKAMEVISALIDADRRATHAAAVQRHRCD